VLKEFRVHLSDAALYTSNMSAGRVSGRRASSPSLHMMQDMAEAIRTNEDNVQEVAVIKNGSAQAGGGKAIRHRRASSPTMHMMMEMAEDDDNSTRATESPTSSPGSPTSDLSFLMSGFKELEINDMWSCQATTDDDTAFSRQLSKESHSTWGRQTSYVSEPEKMAKMGRRGRRASSPSLHLMEDMAKSHLPDETEEQTVTKKTNAQDKPRRRASSPSVQLMLEMADEA